MHEGGRPEHEPTSETRKMAEKMSTYGIPQETICSCIGISLPTLHKHYRHELDTGAAFCIVNVADRLIHKALVENDAASIIFFLKTRAGWSEKNKDDNTNKALTLVEMALAELALKK